MEQQTISVAKAGIIATLNARTSGEAGPLHLLQKLSLCCTPFCDLDAHGFHPLQCWHLPTRWARATTRNCRWWRTSSCHPRSCRASTSSTWWGWLHWGSILHEDSRTADLLCCDAKQKTLRLQLLDKANEASDRKLARHLVSLYGNGVGRLGNEVNSSACLPACLPTCMLSTCSTWFHTEHPHFPTQQADMIPMDTLRDYIAYARATCFPTLQPEAANVTVCSAWLAGILLALSASVLRIMRHSERLYPAPLAGAVPGIRGDAQPGHEQKGGDGDWTARGRTLIVDTGCRGSLQIVSATPRQLESLIRLSGGRPALTAHLLS